MRVAILIGAAVVLGSGCGAMLKEHAEINERSETVGWVGCPEAEIEIHETQTYPPRWTALCHGKRYYCAREPGPPRCTAAE
ncbi:MAG TPA: hypothetical protein VF331_11415 [Polyangiales bacterium]